MKQYRLLLRERNFLKFITSISLIYLAQSIVDVTIIWLVYEKTQQPLFIALSVFITQVPSLVSAPFLGTLMDKMRVSRAISLASPIKAVIFIILCLLSIHINKGTSKNTSRASRASNLSLIYSLFLVNFCL